MSFSDVSFLYIFLPIFLLLYYFSAREIRNGLLFLGSLVFYAFGCLEQPLYLLLLIAVLGITYGVGRWLQSAQKGRRAILAVTVCLLALPLIFYKYTDFFFRGTGRFLALLGKHVTVPQLGLLLPLGLSFYLFQAVAYLVDVYRRDCEAETDFLSFGAYLCMFPYLLSGPLVSYSHLRPAMASRTLGLSDLADGLRLFLVGLGFKVLLADNVGGLWREVTKIGCDSISTGLAWAAIWAFAFQLYFDFYGYSLMAKGLGRMLGFSLPDNFREPYMSRSMTDFWRRWHITLGQWFKNYVYIPLGGNRAGALRTVINLGVVWLFTGLWHGAASNFLVWCFVLFLLILGEKFIYKKYLDKFPVLGHLYMLLMIPLCWMIFAIDGISGMGVYLGKLFPFLPTHLPALSGCYMPEVGMCYVPYLAAGAVFSTGLPRRLYEKYKDTPVMTVLLALVMVACIYCICQGANDPFMYFRF